MCIYYDICAVKFVQSQVAFVSVEFWTFAVIPKIGLYVNAKREEFSFRPIRHAGALFHNLYFFNLYTYFIVFTIISNSIIYLFVANFYKCPVDIL